MVPPAAKQVFALPVQRSSRQIQSDGSSNTEVGKADANTKERRDSQNRSLSRMASSGHFIGIGAA